MREMTRRKRAILRDRRRDNRDEALYGPPLIRALTGFDFYLMGQRHRVAELAETFRLEPIGDPFHVISQITITEE